MQTSERQVQLQDTALLEHNNTQEIQNRVSWVENTLQTAVQATNRSVKEMQEGQYIIIIIIKCHLVWLNTTEELIIWTLYYSPLVLPGTLPENTFLPLLGGAWGHQIKILHLLYKYLF